MIQRIQTLFLLGVVIISIVLFFVPVSEIPVPDDSSAPQAKIVLSVMEANKIEGETVTPEQPRYVLLILNLLVMAAAVYIIFLFKNRASQIRLTVLTGLLSGVLMVMVFYYSDQMAGEGVKVHYLAGIYLIAAQVFLLLAARRAIRKDEQLIRAADRIR
jgi:hypothetical protein